MLSDGFVVEVLKQITDERLQKVDLGARGGEDVSLMFIH